MKVREGTPRGAGAGGEVCFVMATLLSSREASTSAFSGGMRREAERRLMRRVAARCGAEIARACHYSSVPRAFVAALVANESGGNARAARFEPSVYNHLLALSQGRRVHYGGIRREVLEAEVADMLHPKAASYHAVCLPDAAREAPSGGSAETSLLGDRQATRDGLDATHLGQPLRAQSDEALRELATSWGFTQIMGYHLIGRPGTVRHLLDPAFHFKLALTLLTEFAERYQLDLRREFPEMFRCWNTGRPYGETAKPDYVEKGLIRMEIFRALEEA